MTVAQYQKRSDYAVHRCGGGGSSGSDAAGAADQQLAQISQEQWNWFQNTWLPNANQAVANSNQQAGGAQNTYNENIIPGALNAQANLTNQANQSSAVNNAAAGLDMSNANAATQLSQTDLGQATADNGVASTALGTAAGQNAAMQQYGIGGLGTMQDIANYYLSGGGQEAQAEQAAGNVTQQFSNANQQAIAAAQQRGINANSGQMTNVINQNNITEAAANAAAQTQARNAALNLGWQYQEAVQQAGAGMGQQATANTNSANTALSNANSALSNSNSALANSGALAGAASSASNSAVANQQAVGAGLSNVENAVSGGINAAGVPLANQNTIAAGIKGGAESASSAAGQAGQIGAQLNNAQAQQNAGEASGIGSALGGAAALGAALILA